ncbi:hypothetical protein PC129_g5610 [Phytophthora cactorum]|uniref:PH domain-containing protein n=1 Tax=Phytophthora cactorum TaxID=29920 RepID=A0A329SZY5_9STRA|nr:hypothetical protein Pcac1_g8683 [Phytophthora cactorum]KAG2830080.1 hypothetical protein PC111_g7512 [Phytophthora cactorum]KAG2832683.1 hypothetical protein PC112_g6794 [Phytophthora cactorum]KAG2864878.1 hypothetical protein PC113_g4183 [Phytophthora cactorum]KAG2911473.1 hypothetical protein PC114_g9327 [Phytophthora cactorum]
MDTQLPVFSGTLKVHACHLFWTKTPVQLTYHRQDYRHALPVLLIRRPGILGGEFRVPLDPCIHPVRLLPMAKRMASKLEFALEYGWHTKQVRLRAPDAHTYRQWTSLVRAALESGRRPLASCDYTTSAEQPRPDLECSSLASTMDSSSNGTSRFNATIRQRVIEDEQDVQLHLEHDLGRRWHAPSEFFVLHQADYQPGASCGDQDHDVLSQCSIAAVGSCSCDDFRQNIQPARARRRFWPSLRGYIDFHIDWPAITHELYLQASVFYFLL